MTDNSENTFLNFEAPDSIESLETTTNDVNHDEDNIELCPEDFAKLARQASGYHINSADSQDNDTSSSKEFQEEENYDSLSDDEPQKVGLKGPYLKIIIGILLTSTVVISLIFLRGGWLRIMNLSRNQDTTEKKSLIDPRKQEIDRLKAELALMEQSKKPIEPEPQPEPEPEPEPEPQPEPEPEPQPTPQPKPKPIDPYQQWEFLSQLGTLGSSASFSNTFNSASASSQVLNKSEDQSDEESETSQVENRIASSSLTKNLGIKNLVPDSPNQNPVVNKSKFSPTAQRIILKGLGISSTIDNSSKQIAIAKTINGLLDTAIAWTDNSSREETRASVILTEALLYSDGDIALPKNSSIIVEVADFNQADFVTLSAIAIVTKNAQGKVIQQELPEDSLLIRGENNQPLRFKTKNIGSSNSTINQLLGSAVRGGARSLPIPRQVGSSLSRTINSSRGNKKGKIYFIEASTPISIYVNNSIKIKQ